MIIWVFLLIGLKLPDTKNKNLTYAYVSRSLACKLNNTIHVLTPTFYLQRQHHIIHINNLHYEKFQDGTVKCIEDEIPFEVPDGWAWARLKHICMMAAGKSKSTEQIKAGPFEGGYPCFGGNGIRGYVEEYNQDGIFSIIGRQGALCGNINIASGKFYATEHAVVTTLFEGIDFSWSNYTLEALRLNEYATGAAQPGLSVANVLNVFIPVPSTHEQKRIGIKIAESIKLIESIEHEKKDLQALVTNTKSKILDLAIRGKLVPQDPNDEPASVLLERIRAEKEELIKQGKIKRDKKESVIFKGDDNSYYEKIGNEKVNCIDEQLPFELPEGWEWTRLRDISDAIQYGVSNSAETFGDYRLLRITDIQNGHVNWDSVPFTSIDEPEKYLLRKNDIVFARTGATVGKSFFITDLPYASVYASYLIRIRLINSISPNYIYRFFNSNCYWKQVIGKAVGVGQPNCNGNSLKELLVPLPPKTEQQRIVNKTTELFVSLGCVEENLI